MQVKHLKPRPIFVTGAFLAVVITVVILNTDLSPDLYFVHWNPLENVSCHYVEADDALTPGDVVIFPESVFFHETSCKGGLDARQACAVESAARSHPDRQVNVLFTGPATEVSLHNSRRLLEQYRNVNFYRIHLMKYAKGTPLEKLVAGGALNRTKWRVSHTSDVLRYLTLYKWGGIYLDLDVVVTRNLVLAKNWAARESDTAVAAGAMAFSSDKLGRRVALAAIRDIKANYRGDRWGNNGPGVITRVLKSMCSTNDISQMSASTCKGFEVYGPDLFYPIRWQNGQMYFEPGPIGMDAYVYHVWNHHTHQYNVARGSPYEMLAKMFCPISYHVFKDDFGE